MKHAPFLAQLGYEAIDVDLSAVIFKGKGRDPMLDGANWEEAVLQVRSLGRI